MCLEKVIRAVERWENGNWVSIDFSELQKGDKFRMFESTGEPVIGLHGKVEWVATSDPFLNEFDVWAIKTTSA